GGEAERVDARQAGDAQGDGAGAHRKREGGTAGAPPGGARGEVVVKGGLAVRLGGESGEAGAVADASVVEDAAVAAHRMEKSGKGAGGAHRRGEVAAVEHHRATRDDVEGGHRDRHAAGLEARGRDEPLDAAPE